MNILLNDFQRPLHGQDVAGITATFDSRPLSYYRTLGGSETLRDIAALFYGAKWSGLWSIIASANKIENPDVLPAGLILLIPNPGWRVR